MSYSIWEKEFVERTFFEKKFPSPVIPRLDRGIGRWPSSNSWIPRSSRGMTDS
ncbi:MAG: hypothetical protein HYW48_04965 [Deltaproteobacteria bacterium]|nr:hypothetical protein [Deltaproteobacteria bacterium]